VGASVADVEVAAAVEASEAHRRPLSRARRLLFDDSARISTRSI
jgi:hypothetical protein